MGDGGGGGALDAQGRRRGHPLIKTFYPASPFYPPFYSSLPPFLIPSSRETLRLTCPDLVAQKPLQPRAQKCAVRLKMLRACGLTRNSSNQLGPGHCWQPLPCPCPCPFSYSPGSVHACLPRGFTTSGCMLSSVRQAQRQHSQRRGLFVRTSRICATWGMQISASLPLLFAFARFRPLLHDRARFCMGDQARAAVPRSRNALSSPKEQVLALVASRSLCVRAWLIFFKNSRWL